jgi:hypothetical protein
MKENAPSTNVTMLVVNLVLLWPLACTPGVLT